MDVVIPEIVIDNTKLLLNRRGYNNIKYLEESDCGKKPRLLAQNNDNGITVFFIAPNKVTIHVIKSIISTVTTSNIIIVYKHSLTPDAKQSILAGDAVFNFEVFSFDEMSYDPIDAVPIHRKVPTPKEWVKLPFILTSDPVSRYFGWRHGDTIAIEENSGISYRKCVKI